MLEYGADHAAQPLDGNVALVVAEVVVDLLQVVQVDHGDAEVPDVSRAKALRQPGGDLVVGPLVAHLGQGVDVGDAVHLVRMLPGGDQLLGGLQDLRELLVDVLLHLLHGVGQRFDLVAGMDLKLGEFVSDGRRSASPVLLRRVRQLVDRADDRPVDQYDAQGDKHGRQEQQRGEGDQQVAVPLVHHIVHRQLRRGERHQLSVQEDGAARGDHPAVFRRVGHVGGNAVFRLFHGLVVDIVHDRVKAAGRAVVLAVGAVDQIDRGLRLQIEAHQVDALDGVVVLNDAQLPLDRLEFVRLLDRIVLRKVCLIARRLPFLVAHPVLRGVEDGHDPVPDRAHHLRIDHRGGGRRQLLRPADVHRPADIADPLVAEQPRQYADRGNDGNDEYDQLLLQ